MAAGQGRKKATWFARYVGNITTYGGAIMIETELEGDPGRVVMVRVPTSRVGALISSLGKAEAKTITQKLKGDQDDVEKFGKP